MTIILVEHRLEELFGVADRVLMMENGKIMYEGSGKEIIHEIYVHEDERFIPYIPSISRLYMEKESYPEIKDIPLTVKDSKAWIAKMQESLNVRLSL